MSLRIARAVCKRLAEEKPYGWRAKPTDARPVDVQLVWDGWIEPADLATIEPIALHYSGELLTSGSDYDDSGEPATYYALEFRSRADAEQFLAATESLGYRAESGIQEHEAE